MTTYSEPDAHQIIRSLYLPSGRVLRIDRGQGIEITATSGRIWMTEHGRGDDVVLEPGERGRVTGWGRTVLSALRPGRITLAVPNSRALLATLELAQRDGGEGRRLRVDWLRLDKVGRTLRAWFRAAAGQGKRPSRGVPR